MQALTVLLNAVTTLDRELQPTAIKGYSDSELQEICDAIEALQEFKRPIQNEAGRRELSAQNFLLR